MKELIKQGRYINMMKFQSTEHLSTTERLKVVTKEIIKEYPNLNDDDILKIVGLCDIVFDKITEDVIFRRYYYMLLVIKDDKENFDIIYKDMKKYCNEGIKDKLNRYLYADIERYINGEIESFPMISDYYGDE